MSSIPVLSTGVDTSRKAFFESLKRWHGVILSQRGGESHSITGSAPLNASLETVKTCEPTKALTDSESRRLGSESYGSLRYTCPSSSSVHESDLADITALCKTSYRPVPLLESDRPPESNAYFKALREVRGRLPPDLSSPH